MNVQFGSEKYEVALGSSGAFWQKVQVESLSNLLGYAVSQDWDEGNKFF